MHRIKALGLLREHFARRCEIPLTAVAMRAASDPATGAPFEIVTGDGSLDDLRRALPGAEFTGWLNGTDGRCPVGIVREAPAMEPAPEGFRVLAVVPVYDEADILDRTIGHLVANGVEVHIIDNWSTDGCREIAESWRGRGVVAIDTFPEGGATEKFDWQEVLRRIPLIGKASGADWTTMNDADELRESPWPGVTLRDALWHVEQCGFTCVNLTQADFLLTDADVARDGLTPELPLEQAFPCLRSPAIGDLTQLKFWRNGDYDVEIAASGGHTARFPGRRVFPYNFLMRHYPYRSAAQATRKIESRLGRQPEAERRLGWGSHLRPDAKVEFPVPLIGEIRFDDRFGEDYLVERLTAIGWRLELVPRHSAKVRVARALRRLGIWSLYERFRRR